jgi:hypothetical protein
MFEARFIEESFRLNDYGTRDLKFSYWITNNDIEFDLIVSRGAGRPLVLPMNWKRKVAMQPIQTF